jgi:tRNA(adenine34) deaminase
MERQTSKRTAEADAYWMRRALALAERAAAADEVPVGAVVVRDGREIGAGFNAPISGCDPTAHAEVRAIRDAAARIGNYRLSGATLYVSVEPCTMCAGALVHARISRLVYGTGEPKAGAIRSSARVLESDSLNWQVTVTAGVLADECRDRLSSFFAWRREESRKRRRKGKA